MFISYHDTPGDDNKAGGLRPVLDVALLLYNITVSHLTTGPEAWRR